MKNGEPVTLDEAKSILNLVSSWQRKTLSGCLCSSFTELEARFGWSHFICFIQYQNPSYILFIMIIIINTYLAVKVNTVYTVHTLIVTM